MLDFTSSRTNIQITRRRREIEANGWASPYSTNLQRAAEAEDKILAEHGSIYIDCLRVACNIRGAVSREAMLTVATATARQRCEAIYETMKII